METTYSNIVSQLYEINKILKDETPFLTDAYNLLSEQYSYLIDNSEATEMKTAINILNSLLPKSNKQKDYDDTDIANNLLFKDPNIIEKHLKEINNNIQSIIDKNELPLQHNESSLKNLNEHEQVLFQHELLYLISNAFKFKKLQMFIYKFSVHNFPLNTFIPNDTHKALRENFDKTIRSYEKNNLILKYLHNINQLLCPFIQKTLDNFESFYFAYKQVPSNIISSSTNEDKFIYKNIYDSIILNKDLWIRTLNEFEKENKMRFQIDMSKQQLKVFNEIKSVQIYLSRIHPDIDDTNKKRSQQLHNERYAKLEEQSKQITGARKRIEKLRQEIQSNINDYKHHDNKDEYITSTLFKMHSMLLMYALSVNETAYFKEQIWENLLSKYTVKPDNNNTNTNTNK